MGLSTNVGLLLGCFFCLVSGCYSCCDYVRSRTCVSLCVYIQVTCVVYIYFASWDCLPTLGCCWGVSFVWFRDVIHVAITFDHVHAFHYVYIYKSRALCI